MRVLGIVLIIAGVLMLVFRGLNFQTEKTIVDAGPLQINKKENRQIGWPGYAGGVAAIAGVVLVIAAGKRKP